MHIFVLGPVHIVDYMINLTESCLRPYPLHSDCTRGDRRLYYYDKQLRDFYTVYFVDIITHGVAFVEPVVGSVWTSQ